MERCTDIRRNRPAVYFVSDGDGFCKVGCAQDLRSRLGSLQTGNARELQLIHVIYANDGEPVTTLEHRVHVALEGKRVRGEWFEQEAVEQYIDNGTTFYKPKQPKPAKQKTKKLRKPKDEITEMMIASILIEMADSMLVTWEFKKSLTELWANTFGKDATKAGRMILGLTLLARHERELAEYTVYPKCAEYDDDALYEEIGRRFSKDGEMTTDEYMALKQLECTRMMTWATGVARKVFMDASLEIGKSIFGGAHAD